MADELPSIEKSLKFMAWDQKKSREAMESIVLELKQINQSLFILLGKKGQIANSAEVKPDEVPF